MMTELQAIAHQEQMDAMRRDFQASWKYLRELMENQGYPTAELVAAMRKEIGV